jgi:DedD protein
MKWAFWRRRQSKRSGGRRADPQASSQTNGTADKSEVDPARGAALAEQLRVRARRRLIGAAVLLLGAAVIVPMFLDPAPRPLPDNIPIDIPSERTPFSPRLSLPADGGAEPPARAAADQPSESAAQAVQDSAAATPPPTAKESAKAADPGPGTAPAPRPEAGHWFVQAAALSSQAAAQQLAERLSKAGLSPFVERVEGADGVLYRVRMGPYTSKDGAARTRKHLKALGVESATVHVEASAR